MNTEENIKTQLKGTIINSLQLSIEPIKQRTAR